MSKFVRTLVGCSALVTFVLILGATPADAQECSTGAQREEGSSNQTCPGTNPFYNTNHSRTYGNSVSVACRNSGWRTGGTGWATEDQLTVSATGACGPGPEDHAPLCPAVFDSLGISYQGGAPLTSGHWRGTLTGHSKIFQEPGACVGNGSTTTTEDVYGEECNGSYCCGDAAYSACTSIGEFDWNNCACVISPIILDLGGKGFDLTDARHGVIFDLIGRGDPAPIGWTAKGANNAFLALDRNGNGVIDDGTELFGSATPQPEPVAPNRVNGYAALAVFDVNGDGVIDRADPVFGDLVLWRDSNHNGITDTGELLSLREAYVVSLDVTYRESRRTDAHGNIFRYRSKVTFDEPRRSGQRWSYDVFLVGLSGPVTGNNR